jgi:hypothetical protein
MQTIPITLDKERHLKFSWNSLVKFKQVRGKSILKGELDLKDEEDLQAFVWALLYWEDRTLTPDQVGELIVLSDVDISELVDKMVQAYTDAAPGGDGNPPNRPMN